MRCLLVSCNRSGEKFGNNKKGCGNIISHYELFK
jgi:hypothetical protein